ncbi:hypothetical protein [Pseudomonas syringae]|uniref:hypothetical protein n=1 Tax=Pseudomonas syringae TaxID=317 RepID=UPI000B19B803|nr:hypothetical protein [Pseudomonas syringae]RML67714.1 hypothetical protein ALQ91_200121 [Pseudomonas syringae pv. syringae]
MPVTDHGCGVVPLKASIAVAGMLAVVFSGSAFSAKPPSKPVHKPKDLSVQKDVVNDGYFALGECERYIADLPPPEQDVMREVSSLVEIDETIYFVSGNDSVAEDFQSLFSGTRYIFNPKLVESKALLRNKPDLHQRYSDEIYSRDKSISAIGEWRVIADTHAKKAGDPEAARHYLYCRIAAVATGMGIYANHFKGYLEYVQSRVKEAEIGYFKVSADSAYYGPAVNTGNRFAEPKKWDGSRFFVIRASFKNLDTESRLPSEGSLFINYNGKDYEFDSVEPVMLEGFNIWFKKVNPLITMRTKIVYRIPDEIHGEVFWRPGRNPNGTKLWLGFIKAAEAN